jgi:hypothetical protein
MPRLAHLWLGTVTAGKRNSGTNSRIILIVNPGGERMDSVHHTISVTSQDDLERNQANMYEVSQDQFNTIFEAFPATVDTELLNESSIRLGIRGGDAWTPESVFVWGREQRDAGDIAPLGLVVDLHPSAASHDSLLRVTLSMEAGEGQTSFAIPQAHVGGPDMIIRGLIFLMVTADDDDAGTDDPIRVLITTVDGRLVVDETITDTGQRDQERGQANIYFLPVRSSFTKLALLGGRIELRIGGSDSWLPASLFLFGLDEELPTQFSHLVEPLVHLETWPFGRMSTDVGEGQPSVVLPLVASSLDPP